MPEDSCGKNDAAWELIFAAYPVLKTIKNQGFYDISSQCIKEFREPRLMTKFDHQINVPRLFRKHALGILPLSRGSYRIAPMHCYAPFPASQPPVHTLCLPDAVSTINPAAITSEAVALNCALVSGMFAHFTGEDPLYPTVSGRMGSGEFAFSIDSSIGGSALRMEVHNAQIEIDAALEGRDSLLLVEAKCDLAEDFIIRQLYYPYRTWANKTRKCVRPLFLTYSNGIFDLCEYIFTSPDNYSSIGVLRHGRYAIESTLIYLHEIAQLAAQVPLLPEPYLPFPQADRFERVINLCELLRQGALSRDDITRHYEFDARQADYYANAAAYLGLAEKAQCDGKPAYGLSPHGHAVLALGYKDRQLAFCRAILEHGVFNEIFFRTFQRGAIPPTDEIAECMKYFPLFNIHGETTFKRRASTVAGWVRWIMGLGE